MFGFFCRFDSCHGHKILFNLKLKIMTTQQKENLLKTLPRHIQGLAAIVSQHGFHVKGLNGSLFAIMPVTNLKTGEELEEWFPLKETTTIKSLLEWLGY